MSNIPTDRLNTPIKFCKTFEEISEWRKASFNVDQNSGNNFKDILSDIYSEPTHFLFELLQNADDAKATKVRFEVKSDKIVFYHNGTKDFSPNDIISITGIGNSTKTETEQSIGKFGVGFKAVFAITKTPKIWSKAYNFKIKNLTVPYKIDAIELGKWTTIFELEYASDKYNNDDLYQRIINEVNSLDIQTILFLRNILELELATDNYRTITLTKNQYDGYTEFSDTEDGSKYLVFYGGYNDRTSIAYKLNADGIITKPRNTNVSVYFPTQIKSFFGFIVNAPFNTPRTRETIDFAFAFNQDLVNEVKTIFRSSILKLRDLGLWTLDTIQDIMPINSELCEQSYIYNYLYDVLVEAFKQEKLVPVKGSNYALAGMVNIAADYNISKLLNDKKKKWATVYSSHDLLKTFYKNELGILTIDFKLFIIFCSTNYLKKQKTRWLYQFYGYCSEQLEKQFGNYTIIFLKQQPIIKSRSGNFVAAYVGESQNIFLNSKGLSNARIVDNIFTSNAKSVPKEMRDKLQKLLDKLDIKLRSPKSTIELDIMSKWEKSDFNARKQLFFDIVKIYNESNKDEKEEISKYLSDKNILYTTSGEWLSENVYQNTANLHLLFDSVYDASYIQPDFWIVDYKEREIIQKDGTKKLVKECHGSNDLLEVLGVSNSLSVRRREYTAIPAENILKHYDVPVGVGINRVKYTYVIHNFCEILKNINNFEKSKALVVELIALSDDRYQGCIEWYTSMGAYKPKKNYLIPAQFLLDLRNEKWIFNNNGRCFAPNEVFKDDFIKWYEINKSDKLLEFIDFKPSIRKSLPIEDQEKLALVDFFTVEELKEFKRQKDAEKDSEKLPEISIEDDTRSIVLNENDDFVESETESNHSEISFNEEPHESIESESTDRKHIEKITIKKTDNTKLIIGDQGERTILEHLKKQLSNTSDIPGGFISDGKKFLVLGNNNPGYDIEVSKDDEIIEYIEVKARTTESNSVVITHLEWEYAKKYGDKYTIYIVDGVLGKGDKEAPLSFHKYNNPYKLHIDGKITLTPDSYRLA